MPSTPLHCHHYSASCSELGCHLWHFPPHAAFTLTWHPNQLKKKWPVVILTFSTKGTPTVTHFFLSRREFWKASIGLSRHFHQLNETRSVGSFYTFRVLLKFRENNQSFQFFFYYTIIKVFSCCFFITHGGRGRVGGVSFQSQSAIIFFFSPGENAKICVSPGPRRAKRQLRRGKERD